MQIRLPEYVKEALALLEKAGYETFCVGGCVRDSLMGRNPADWDITTSAVPEEIEGVFEGYKLIETGIKHGTVTVLCGGASLEITTYRIDGSYSDSRHPDSITFSKNLSNDLARRDFTVNSLAYSEKTGIIDIFGGEEDIENRCIRCVGEPEKRFSEDALRIMRCLRFAACLGFEIDAETREAALGRKELLGSISAERIRDELIKLVCAASAANVMRKNSEILFEILPELRPLAGCTQECKYHIYDVWEHTLHALESPTEKLSVRMALLLHDSGKPEVKSFDETGTAHFYGHAKVSAEIAEKTLRRLRFSNEEIKRITGLVLLHGASLPMSDKRVKKLIANWGEEFFFELCEVFSADMLACNPEYHGNCLEEVEELKKRAERFIAEDACLNLKKLAVNGNDLLALGFHPGRELGMALQELLELAVDEKLDNSREALISAAEVILKKSKTV